MKNRTFRSDRLYKIASIVIILLTVYFAFNAFSSYSRLADVREYPSECNKEYLKSDYTECLKLMHGTVNNVETNTRNYAYIALTLPLVFFGGTLLYKYTFPKKRKV